MSLSGACARLLRRACAVDSRGASRPCWQALTSTYAAISAGAELSSLRQRNRAIESQQDRLRKEQAANLERIGVLEAQLQSAERYEAPPALRAEATTNNTRLDNEAKAAKNAVKAATPEVVL